MMGKFSVGVGRADITPEVGGPLQGYTPWRNSECINDHLHLTVYLIEQGETRVILAAADLVSIPTALDRQLRPAMAEIAGTIPQNIILGATHTHSGPATACDADGKCRNPGYFENILLPAAIAATKDAVANLQPAQMGVGTTESQVGINRRQLTKDGRIILGQEPHGLYDPTMTVLSFRTPEGKILGNLVHYGCHNTGSGKNVEITRDWCGVMIDRMDALTGGITAFVNGCEGDCGPRLANGKTTGNLQMALELGGKAAIDGMRAFNSIREWEDEIDLRVICETVRLPYGKIASEEAMVKELEELGGDPTKLTGEPLIFYNGVKRQLDMLRSGKAAEFEAIGGKDFEISIIAVGPIAFVPLPFETFSGITMRISRHSPFPWTVVMSIANGSGNGYFPTQDQLCMGGYEVHNFRFPAGYPLADNADQHMVTGALNLLEKLYND